MPQLCKASHSILINGRLENAWLLGAGLPVPSTGASMMEGMDKIATDV